MVDRYSAVSEEKSNPKISELREIYGDMQTIKVIRMLLISCFKFCGFNLPSDENEAAALLERIAQIILNLYGYLRIRELSLFLSDYELGKLGDFYRSFSSQQFFISVDKWLRVRSDLREGLQKKLEAQQREQMAMNAVPCPDEYDIARRFQKQFEQN